MSSYRYVDNGDGVPGLPFEISDEEAAAQGVSELLRAAIENGNYVRLPATHVAGTGDAGLKPARLGRKRAEESEQP